jgi:2-oxoglutarate ferredoxin oxidoreductase subunit alpha
VPVAVEVRQEGARYGVISLGGCDLAVREAMGILKEQGHPGNYLRVRGFPFGEEIEAFLAAHDILYVVEQNRDAQLKSLLILETQVPKHKLRSVLAYSGFPLQAKQVVDGIIAQGSAV